MPNGYLPVRELDLLTWSKELSTKLLASPEYYGVTALQANAYDEVQVAFASAYAVAHDPTTRIKANLVAKNNTKKALIDATRPLVAFLQASPVMTDEKRGMLGIPIRDREPTPVPVPSEHPELTVVAVMSRTIRIKLRSTSSEGRGRPAGVAGATVYYAVGESFPQEIEGWMFKGNVSVTTFDLTIPVTVPGGSKVWLAAAWYNAKAQSGPACQPVETAIAGGLAQAA